MKTLKQIEEKIHEITTDEENTTEYVSGFLKALYWVKE